MKKIYLAIPYSGIEDISFDIANKFAGQLMKENNIVCSPISQNHPIAKVCDLPTDFEFWKNLCNEFVSWSEKVVVINIIKDDISLLENSKGCQAEIKLAKELNKEIYIIDYKI